jgi:hypothetical protein
MGKTKFITTAPKNGRLYNLYSGDEISNLSQMLHINIIENQDKSRKY